VNLLANAKDATEGRSDRLIEVETRFSNGELVLSVTDNGHGIDPSHLETIFEPFFTTKEVNKGTGIGLSLVSTILKEHGGRVEVKSTLGAGTCFTVYLPVKPTTTAVSDDSIPANSVPFPTARKPRKILVVDDEAELREMLKHVLVRKGGAEVMTASGALEALRLIEQGTFDLVISDVKMPTMDGFELHRRLRQLKLTKVPRFMFISGGIDLGPEERLMIERDTDGLLPKPFDLAFILRRVQELFPSELDLVASAG
jgi:CheY-like chemotaxis protein